MHRARATAAAGAMDVEEGDAVSFVQVGPVEAVQRSANPLSSVPADTCPGMIGYGTPASRPCQRWTSVPHTSERSVRSSAEPAGRSGRSNSRISIGCARRGHHGGEDAIAHGCTLPYIRPGSRIMRLSHCTAIHRARISRHRAAAQIYSRPEAAAAVRHRQRRLDAHRAAALRQPSARGSRRPRGRRRRRPRNSSTGPATSRSRSTWSSSRNATAACQRGDLSVRTEHRARRSASAAASRQCRRCGSTSPAYERSGAIRADRRDGLRHRRRPLRRRSLAGWGLGSQAFVVGGIGRITRGWRARRQPDLRRRGRRTHGRPVRRAARGQIRLEQAGRPGRAPRFSPSRSRCAVQSASDDRSRTGCAAPSPTLNAADCRR